MNGLKLMRIVRTTVSAVTKAVLVDIDSAPVSAIDNEFNEGASKQEFFSALGLVVRPLPSIGLEQKKGASHAEALCDPGGAGLVPLSFRDLRLNKLFPNPKDGEVALVGYGGSFDSHSGAFDGDNNPTSAVRVTYVPYAYVNGVPTKAHTIIADGTPGNESISIVHGDGATISMLAGKKIAMAADGETFLMMEPGKIAAGATNIILQGNVVLGKTAVGALPLVVGGTPSPSVFVSPV